MKFPEIIHILTHCPAIVALAQTEADEAYKDMTPDQMESAVLLAVAEMVEEDSAKAEQMTVTIEAAVDALIAAALQQMSGEGDRAAPAHDAVPPYDNMR